MKKNVILCKALAITLGITMIAGMAGCGKSSKSSGDIKDYVTLGEYKNLDVDLTVSTTTDQDVEEQIQSDLEDNSTNEEVTDRTDVQAADIVNMDIKATVDGEDYEDADADDYDYTIGDNEYGEAFDNGLIGKNVGESVELTVTLPEDYSDEEYAGKEAKFNVTINSIKKEVIPEFTDEFVASISDDCKTTAEYREYVKNDLQTTADSDNEDTAKEDLMSTAVENAKVNGCPDDLYNLYYNQMTKDYTSYAEQWGMKLEDFLSSYMGMDEEAFKEYVLDQVYDMEVVKMIADKENIKVSNDEYKENLQSYVDDYGWESADELEKTYSKDYLKNTMLREKVTQFLFDNANVTKVPEEDTEDDADAADIEEETESETETVAE